VVDPFGPPSEPEPPSVADILAKFKAEQAALPEPAPAKVNGSNPNGYEIVNPSVFDRLAELITFAEILEPLSWVSVRPPDASTSEAWRRPGATHPVSAKVLKANPHVLVVWSEDAGLPSGAGQKLTKARLHAHLHYGGNESAFAKALTRGEAIGIPSHVNDTFRAERGERPANVTLVTAAEITSTTAHDLILPDTFYESRPVLRQIRDYAHSRGVAADMVLYSNLSHISGMLPPECRLETGIGSTKGASLNLFIAAISNSSGGKSTGSSVSRDMYAPPAMLDFIDGAPLGSGEGLAEAYMGQVWREIPGTEVQRGPRKGEPRLEKVREQVRRNAFYFADEGEMFTKLQERSGSTLSQVIRSAWYGSTLGNTNADSDRNRIIREGDYSMGMFIGFQPETARPLLADSAAGTPQRFLCCSAIDPNIPPTRPTRNAVQPQIFQPRPQKVQLPDEIADLVWQHHHNKVTGVLEVPRLDGHGMLTRLKLAALLTLLDGRYVVSTSTLDTVGDWELAEIMWDTSCKVRDHYLADAEQQATRDRHTRNQHYADREEMAEARRQQVREASTKVQRVARLMGKYVHDQAKPAKTIGDVNRRLESVNRPQLTEALDYAVLEGWVEVDGTNVTPGPSKPA
jgi:hypothetical protein